jgi:thymidylate synthase
MNKLDLDYQNLLKDILENGTKKETRNGSTLSVFGRQIRHKMSEGFPLLTTKKMSWKSIVTELLWFLRGDTNIKYLVDNDTSIWNGDAYKNWCRQFEVDPNNFDGEELMKGHNDQCWGYPLLENTSKEYKRGQINAYLEGKGEKPFFYLTQEEFIKRIKTDNEFAKKWGELGPIYGKQWRDWKGFHEGQHDILKVVYGTEGREHYLVGIDQIANLINDLKTNPDSRRLMVNAWNVGELDQMVLPPCHNLFQMYSVEKEGKRHLSIMVNIRSNDVPLGLPFNIASYALLLEIIARLTNMISDEIIINIGDAHIYLNQIEGIKEQLTREPFGLPKLVIYNQVNFNEGIDEFLNSCLITDFRVEDYISHPSIKLPLSN